MMRRADALVVAGVGLLGATASVARLRAMQSLSPPDLAFFHQATWSAARGLGFSQTALEFDAGTLFGSIHLSLVRAAWVPLYVVLPAPETLVALQGLVVVGGSAWAARSMLPTGAPRVVGVLLVGLSPLTLALGACDLRPITFLVAPAVWVAAGLVRSRPLWVGLGIVGVLIAREEGWMVLVMLLPLALRQARRSAVWTSLPLLVGGAALGVALPWLVWGHGGNITANPDPLATLEALVSGTRPWIRWPVEAWFGLRTLVVAWPALWCPELLLPALVAWSALSIFSELEPAAPGHGGLHYLSVVAPLVLAAVAVGLGRVWTRSSTARRKAVLGLAVGGLALSAPELHDTLRWTQEAAQPTAFADEVAHLRASPGPVLAVPMAAPLLSGRPVLHIQGHFAPTPDRVTEVAQSVHHAVLLAESPRDGPAEQEWTLWQSTLQQAGLTTSAPLEGYVIWSRSSPADR